MSNNFLKFCIECGTKNEENELFCGNCGNLLEKSAKSINQGSVSLNSSQTDSFKAQPHHKEVYPIQSKHSVVYPTPKTNIDAGLQLFSKYPVSWDEGISIALGGVLFTYGLGVLIFVLLFLAAFGFAIEFLLFFGILPIIIGYFFLRSYMNFIEMIKFAFGLALVAFALVILLFTFVFSFIY